MRQPNNILVQGTIYFLLRMLIAAVEAFPEHFLRRVAAILGRIICLFDIKHRPIAFDNIAKAQPPVCAPDEISTLVRRMYEHIALSILEMCRTPRILARRELQKYVSVEETHIFDRVLARGRGAIVVVAHLGNWEVGGVALCLAGYRLNSLARPVQNRFLNRYLNHFRSLTGQNIIPRDGALQTMRKILKGNGILVIQADLDARESGIFPTFFGRQASTTRSPALLALRYDIPIIPIEVFRGPRRIVLRLHDPIDPEPYRRREDAVLALTQTFTDFLETLIRRHPEQWFWLHRRWKARYLREHREKEEVRLAAARSP